MDIYSAKRKHLEKLLAKEGVVSVGVGFKKVCGKRTETLSIVIGVKEKKAVFQLRKRDIVPRSLSGFPTDVEEVGEMVLRDFKALNSYTERLRPARPGISIGHYLITAGTFGCVVVDNSSGERLILSNNHVVARVNKGELGDPILQPGPHDGGTVENDKIARLLRFVPIKMIGGSGCPITRLVVATFNTLAKLLGRVSRIYSYSIELNKVDCAVARPYRDEDVDGAILGLGNPVGIAHAEVGHRVRKVGRTTELTEGVVSQVDVTTSVNMGEGNMAVFEEQIAIEGVEFSAPGDSGSVVLKGLEAVGLLFAGSDTITMVNRIQNVLEALEVSIP